MGELKYLSTERIVEKLLRRGVEGEFWDFKQEWHKDMKTLMKDIICFANTSHDEKCFIIFGVDDSCNVTGMMEPRRKQADILEALLNLWFAGDIVPEISVETIIVQRKEIDVLTISDMEQTPVYLKKNYGDMLSGCIYMRIGDKNTPSKGNANIGDIEKLWKKRFGLLKPPLSYIYDRLFYPLEWKQREDTYYNVYKPEYQLEIHDEEDDRLIPEFYSYAMTNESTRYQKLEIKHGNTVLDSYQIVVLDSGRYRTPTPEWGFICNDQYGHKHKYEYKYYVIGSERYKLYRFFLDSEDDEGRIANRNFMEVVLMYESEEEHSSFECYVESNQELVKERVEMLNCFSGIRASNERYTKVCQTRLRVGICLNDMLKEFRTRS